MGELYEFSGTSRFYKVVRASLPHVLFMGVRIQEVFRQHAGYRRADKNREWVFCLSMRRKRTDIGFCSISFLSVCADGFWVLLSGERWYGHGLFFYYYQFFLFFRHMILAGEYCPGLFPPSDLMMSVRVCCVGEMHRFALGRLWRLSSAS